MVRAILRMLRAILRMVRAILRMLRAILRTENARGPTRQLSVIYAGATSQKGTWLPLLRVRCGANK
eukprot:5695565-Pyramimonas_sp.AAC.1